MLEITEWTAKSNAEEKELLFFDFEVFPKFWNVVFASVSGGVAVVSSDDENFRELMLEQVLGRVLVGFNIKRYDMKILNAIISGRFSPSELGELSNNIINDVQCMYNDYSYWNKYNFIDLYDDYMGSLKEFESNQGMMIKESDIDFEKVNLTDKDKAEIIEYCKYDVRATIRLYRSRMEYIKSKVTLCELFKLDLWNTLKSTNAKLVATILNPLKYEIENDYPFVIPDRCNDYVLENVPKMVVDFYLNTPVTKIEKFELSLFDNKIVLGSGGIHSVIDEDIICETDDEFAMYNIDVTSYYPNLIINFGYMSRKAQNKNLYADIYRMRYEAKKAGKKDVANALKLVLNTTYGAMKDKFNKLYDFYQASNVCILGQLLLLGLAHKLYNDVNAKIIQTNTDGILVYIPRDRLEHVQKIVADWEATTGMFMEWDEVAMFMQRDVNNYIEVKNDGEIKLKGKWCNQADDEKGNLNAPITHRAIVDYYTKGIPVDNTICACDDIRQFCFTSKTGRTFDKTFHFIDGERIEVNKVNRSIATSNQRYGTIKKWKKENDRYDKQAEISEHVKLVNEDLTSYNIQELEIDYNFYINFTKNKILDLKKVKFEKSDLIF